MSTVVELNFQHGATTMSSTPFEHDTITTREMDGHAMHDADWLAALRSEAVQNIVKTYHTTVNADSHGAPVPVVRLHTLMNIGHD